MKRPEGTPGGKPIKTGRIIVKTGIVSNRFKGCGSNILGKSRTYTISPMDAEKQSHSTGTSYTSDMESPEYSVEVKGQNICTPSAPPVKTRSPNSV